MNLEIDRVDEELLKPRKVVQCGADEKFGFGYNVTFECQHECWSAVLPGREMHCAVCLDLALMQLRGYQKERARDDE